MPAGDQRLRALVADYFGEHARVRQLRPTAVFGAPVFVVDFDRGVRHYRTLGSFGPDQQVTEQSSMDLIYPAHLVFHYERLMSLAFALCDRPINALLLGVGGAAMWRFMRAYLPDCAPTLVDSDETIVSIARRWFYLSQPVVIEIARDFLARTTQRFDAILVDLYEAGGPAANDVAFWSLCLDRLAPGGCLATNWADFATNRQVKGMAAAQEEAVRARGLDCVYVTRRGFRDNLVQYVPAGALRGPEAIAAGHEHFARDRRLPDRGRGILENCVVTTGFPVDLW
jgi:predicted O-methyltransferase YrrM